VPGGGGGDLPRRRGTADLPAVRAARHPAGRGIDYQAEEPLALALAEAIRLDGDLTINLAHLAFIDAPCTRLIMDAAHGLAESRQVRLVCSAAVARRFDSCGAGELAGIGLVTVDER
jgi:anti-anti-sigma regulatory factor